MYYYQQYIPPKQQINCYFYNLVLIMLEFWFLDTIHSHAVQIFLEVLFSCYQRFIPPKLFSPHEKFYVQKPKLQHDQSQSKKNSSSTTALAEYTAIGGQIGQLRVFALQKKSLGPKLKHDQSQSQKKGSFTAVLAGYIANEGQIGFLKLFALHEKSLGPKINTPA